MTRSSVASQTPSAEPWAKQNPSDALTPQTGDGKVSVDVCVCTFRRASVLDTLQDLSSIGLAALAFGALFVLLHALDRV